MDFTYYDLCKYSQIRHSNQWQAKYIFLTYKRNPTRGSNIPLIFFMCAEGPSALLSKAENVGQIMVIMIARGCQPINHLIFADNSILFCQATVTKWQHIQTILTIYEEASSQCINKQKTTILLSSNTSENIKH